MKDNNVLDDPRSPVKDRSAGRSVQLFALAAGSYLSLLGLHLWRTFRFSSAPGKIMVTGIDLTVHLMVTLIIFGVLCAISGLWNAVAALRLRAPGRKPLLLGFLGNLAVVIVFFLILIISVAG